MEILGDIKVGILGLAQKWTFRRAAFCAFYLLRLWRQWVWRTYFFCFIPSVVLFLLPWCYIESSKQKQPSKWSKEKAEKSKTGDRANRRVLQEQAPSPSDGLGCCSCKTRRLARIFDWLVSWAAVFEQGQREIFCPPFHLWEALSARVQQGSISHPLLFGESDSVLLSWSSGGASCGAGHWARSWRGGDYSLWSMFWWCLGAIDPIRQGWREDQNVMIPSSF